MADLRDAYRSLRGTPVVSAIAILSLALGIGANTAIFSIVNSLLLRSLPVVEPQRLGIVSTSDGNDSWTYPIWEQVDARRDLFAGTAAWASWRFNTARAGEVRLARGLMVSGRFFDVLGVPAILGRTITASDDRVGGGPDGPVAVIGYDYWQRQFGGTANAIGQSLTLDRIPFTVVGVAPPEFFGPVVGSQFDIAVPFGTEPLLRGKESQLEKRSAWWLSILVRRKADQTEASAEALLRGVQPQVRQATLPPNFRPQDIDEYLKDPFVLVAAANGASVLRTRYERPLLTILVVVGLVLLVACANIANLLLARASARRHEMSVRLALGASRWRLARQLLAESLLVSVAGSLLGLAFAAWGGRLLVAQLSTRTSSVYLDLSLDWRVLGFTALVAVATAVLFGTAPAFRAARTEPNDALKAQGRGVHGEGRLTAGNLLVVTQVALSLVLVVAGGLFVRTFVQLASRSLGFDRDKVLVTSVELLDKNTSEDERVAIFRQLRDAATAIPGVESAALSAVTPVSGSTWQFLVEIPDAAPLAERDRVVHVNIVSPNFFRTFGTRLKAGRDFTEADQGTTAPVVIVNETFARRYFNGGNPVGRRLRQSAFPNRPAVDREIVGAVEDAVYRNLRQTIPPTIYIPYTQQPALGPYINVSLRAAAGSPARLTRAAADAFTRVTPNVTLTMRTLAEQVSNSLIQERLVAILSGFFAGLALLLAAIGLYGLTSYAVTRRRSEIGIRMALGAAPSSVMRLVLARVAVLVCGGVAIGTVASLWVARFVSTLLFGLQPRDPVTLIGAAVVLGAIGALAGWLPARRAAALDPARVLREG